MKRPKLGLHILLSLSEHQLGTTKLRGNFVFLYPLGHCSCCWPLD